MYRAIFRSPDGQSGLFFVIFGAAVAIGALQYPLGTPAQMGPGFFPFGLGVLLAIVGAIVLVQAIRSDFEEMPRVDWRAVGIITAAIILSAVLLLTAGLLVAIPVLVVVSSLAARNIKPLSVAVTALALTAMAYAIFIWALGLRIPVLWS